MPPLSGRHAGQAYWRSLDELAQTPAFRARLEAEFPGLAAALHRAPSRREFLRLMGAALGLAGLTACRWPSETIVPFASRPEGRIPGVPLHYATAWERGGVASGLLVKSHDGRPIKVEGNDRHPFSAGKSDALAQGSLLELYDPDRSQRPVQRRAGRELSRSWEEFAAFARAQFAGLRRRQGAGLALLSEASSSPSLAEMKARLLEAFPQAGWYEYEPLSRDNERQGTRLVFGRPYRPQLNLAAAEVIVSLDADLLMAHPAAVRYTRDFARRRTAADGTMNRLYVFESNYTVTGSVADQRYAVRCAAVGDVAARLALETGGRARATAAPRAAEAPVAPAVIAALAAELVAHRGRCLVAVGPRQPAAVHACAHQLNWQLGNVGRTVLYTPEPDPERPTHVEAIAALSQRMRAGAIDTLVILGGNPVYDAPVDLEFGRALAGVPTSIHLSLYDNETSRACTWHQPRAHYLESWGDARAYDGTVSIVQPLIAPLYAGKTPAELLALLVADAAGSGYEITRRTFRARFAAGLADFEDAWRQALQQGFIAGTAWPSRSPTLRAPAPRAAPPPAAGFEVVFAQDYSVYDGRFANNGWLQELPDPITKLTWDNAALLAPADADELGVGTGDVLRIGHQRRALEVPAYVLPGHARRSITLPLGYGRHAAGRVAEGAGVNAYALRARDAMGYLAGCRVSRTGRSYPLASTQDHHAIASAVGRRETRRRVPELIREARLEQYRQGWAAAERAAAGDGAADRLPPVALWKEHEYQGHCWGMAIDLTRCTGCSACVVACQAENNIPVVGKQEVARGREMHWIRVDRYFSGDPGSAGPDGPADVKMAHQPLTCHHCANAPCEQVCPVGATLHDREGLNVQVYNRCIGTRYCSNNCPYKVRRFNWFYNHHGPRHPRSRGVFRQARLSEVEKLVFNPQVTVRSRGVMEKCTFCLQRINAAKIAAANQRRAALPDGLITPACAQACPAEAIVFGDLNDRGSRVRRLHQHRRAYTLLEELNLRPRTVYLARLRNPARPGAGGSRPAGRGGAG